MLMNFIFLVSAALIVFLDQLTKYIINQNIPLNGSIEVIPHIFFITHVKNSGVAFGLFPNKTNIFIIVSAVAVILIIILKVKLNINSTLYNISLGFVLGGAIGNLIDRLVLGEVTDFINFVFWPVFNIADSFIVIGFCLLIFIIFKNWIKKGETN